MNEQLVIEEIKLGIGKCLSKSYDLVLKHGPRGIIMLTINIYLHT